MSSASPPGRRKVLLVGWDSADWKVIQPLLDRGWMPALAQVVNGGVMGNLASIRPMLSPMLWNSIATGKRPYRHGVHGFTEVDRELGQPVPISSSTRRCQALWEILNRAGLKTHVVGWFATHPAQPLDGVCVSDRFAAPAPADLDAPWPLAPGTVFPESLGERLAELRLRPEEIDGSVLREFVPEFERVNQTYDKRLHELAIRLAEGFSIHAAATHLLENEPWDFAAVYYRSLDWISHDFMGYRAPRMENVYLEEFALYQHVVDVAYRLHDAFLGRLMQLAGPDATVIIVSDHGFHSDHLRPVITPNLPAAIADWHRPVGVLAMRGAGLRQDELIHGASLLDITPTILTLFGLPTGADMDGRVLAEAFADLPEPGTVESWELSPGDAPAGKSNPARSAAAEWSVIRQFVELGYLDDPGEDPQEAVRTTDRENRWNLARSYLDAHRLTDALPLLEEVYEEWPERGDYGAELALCQLHLGLYDEALATAEEGRAADAGAGGLLLLANIEFRREEYARSIEHLRAAETLDSRQPGLQQLIGLTYVRLRRWTDAEAAYRLALALDADDPFVHLGLAHCHLHAERFEDAAESALRAVGLRFNMPVAHYYLGVAMARLGDGPRAIEALEASLRYQPGFAPAHRYLATLYAHVPGGEEKVQAHRAQLNQRAARREAWSGQLDELRRGIAERAGARREARARRRALTGPVPEQSPDTAPVEPMDFLIVSGLPRSGTSLMMQMLVAGGLEPMRDDLRPADIDNPHGYFEWQEIKSLPRNPRLIEKAHGRVTKVISMLLPSLPRVHRFRVIFMTRPIEDVIASQERMRHRRDALTPPAPPGEMMAELRQHRERMLRLLRGSDNVEVLEVDYPALLDDPHPWAEQVAEFAGISPDHATAMAAAVAPELSHAQTPVMERAES